MAITAIAGPLLSCRLPRPVRSVPIRALVRRSDANADRDLTIVDGQFILNFLFFGRQAPPCFDAADADDSGQLEMNDAIALFSFLFLGTI